MSDRTKDFVLNLGCGVLITLFVFILSYSRRDSFILDNSTLSIFLHCLCDGLFVAAVMLLGTGGLKAVRNQGVFDVIGYGMKYVIETVIPALRSEEENLYSYRERKEASRKSAKSILFAGVVYLVLSIVIMLMYYLFR